MYSRDEVSTLFMSAVNPALKEFNATILKKDGWEYTDIQSHDHYVEFIDNTPRNKFQFIEDKLWSKIDVAKPDVAKPDKLFSYRILAKPTETNPNSYLLPELVIWKKALDGGEREKNYTPDDINTVTKDEFLEHLKRIYDDYRRMIW